MTTILNKLFPFATKRVSDPKELWPKYINTYKSLFDKLIIFGFEFTNIENLYILAKFNSLSFEVRTAEEIYILHEIYYQGCYNFNSSEQYCIIDIGLNVGLASLYFANMPNVTQVYCFEPFLDTYKQAIKNFSYNKIASEKIVSFNYGLGGDNRELELEYCESWKGSLGINGLTNFKKDGNIITKEKVLIRDVNEVISEIIVNQKEKLIFKIDCEGAEYEILKRLKETDLLSVAKIYMIEWHFKGCKEIIEDFTTAGYNCVSLFYDNQVSGIIYAFKN